MKVAALIPAYNEEEYLVQTLAAVDSIPGLDQIVVINDGSTDGTHRAVLDYLPRAAKTIRLVDLPENQGKGSALNAGLACTDAQVYLLLDADLGGSACQAAALLDPVLRAEAHMTVARFTGEQGASGGKMGFGLVRLVAVWGVRLLTGRKVTSPLSGQRAVCREVVQRLGGFAGGFGVEVSLTVGALHHGFTVVEVPLALKHRAYGRTLRGFLHRGRQLVHVLAALGQCWTRGWHRWSGA